jgi:hypothetical protein
MQSTTISGSFREDGNPIHKMEIEDNGIFNKMKNSRTEDEVSDRIGFIRKVFGILSLQLTITACITLIPTLNDNARAWM